jgi:hypothetical protein
MLDLVYEEEDARLGRETVHKFPASLVPALLRMQCSRVPCDRCWPEMDVEGSAHAV